MRRNSTASASERYLESNRRSIPDGRHAVQPGPAFQQGDPVCSRRRLILPGDGSAFYTDGPFGSQTTATISIDSDRPAAKPGVYSNVRRGYFCLRLKPWGIKTGGVCEVYFLDTLAPAANFFSDTNGNPISGINPVGAAPALPPATTTVAISQGSSSDPAGTTHTVTALVKDSTSAPVANTIVKFTITTGPNAGVDRRRA